MKNAPKNLPRIIQAAIKAIECLPSYLVEGVFAVDDNRQQAMHTQRRKTLQALLRCLIAHADMATGKLVKIYQGKKADLTIKRLVEETHICRATICNIMKYLKQLGVLLVAPQNRATMAFDNGNAQFSCSVHRSLSTKFWELIGLGEQYETARDRAYNPKEKVFTLCSIKGASGVHKGHILPIPPENREKPAPTATDNSAVMESIRRAREAQARNS